MMGNANVTNVAITCTVDSYAVGGGITNLVGTGLTLTNTINLDQLMVPANASTYSFHNLVASGSPFNVAVLSNPSAPTQACTFSTSNGGTVGTGPVTNVDLGCVTQSFPLGGTVTGLVGSLTLNLHGLAGPQVTVTQPAFDFGPQLSGSTYDVRVANQPATQLCTMSNNTGTVGGMPINNIRADCVNLYTVSGTTSNLVGNVQLSLNGVETITVLAQANSFFFTTRLVQDSAFTVSVVSMPTGHTCTVSPMSGSATIPIVLTLTCN
jgi:hypothetical protein